MQDKFTTSFLLFIATVSTGYAQENNANKKNRWQINVQYAFSDGSNVSAWKGLETYREGYINKSSFAALGVSFKLTSKSKIQLSYNYTERYSAALIYAGSAFSTNGGYDVFGFSEIINLLFGTVNSGSYTGGPPQTTFSKYYNSIELETFIDYISLTYQYNISEKLKLFKMPVAIQLNGGTVFTGVTENVSVSGYHIENEKLLYQSGEGFRYNYKPGIAISGGIQVAINISRSIVLIPLDFTQRLAVIQPSVPSSEFTFPYSNNYQLTAPKHKINTSGNTIAFGIGFIL